MLLKKNVPIFSQKLFNLFAPSLFWYKICTRKKVYVWDAFIISCKELQIDAKSLDPVFILLYQTGNKGNFFK